MVSSLKNIPPAGLMTNELDSNLSGMVVFSEGTNLKLLKSVAKPTRVCINPNLNPMQFLGPSPKGSQAYGCLLPIFSLVNLSGSNISGSG